MTSPELKARQKSQRLINKIKANGAAATPPPNKLQQFNLYKSKAKNISNPNELLPGLNDISDAFEALPLDLIKYFTLLKEIDAKCINTVPQINYSISRYIDQLHAGSEADEPAANGSAATANGSAADAAAATAPGLTNNRRLAHIKDKILEVIPCLEEKMHVASVATDLLHKHMYRINNDYKLIINNNEIPESIRIGPLNHPAMIMDSQSPNDLHNPNRSAQSARSESRREALAAKKANKDDTADEDGLSGNNSAGGHGIGGTGAASLTVGAGTGKKKGKSAAKEATPAVADAKAGSGASGAGAASTTASTTGKKRQRKDLSAAADGPSRPTTPAVAAQNGSGGPSNSASSSGASGASSFSSSTKKRNTKPKKEDVFVNVEITTSNSGNSGSGNSGNNEPTYCYCNQVSFGEMVGCDGDDCKREWFHLPCIGFKNPPKGKWYCDDCVVKMKKARKV